MLGADPEGFVFPTVVFTDGNENLVELPVGEK
jgi:hypothetical protein